MTTHWIIVAHAKWFIDPSQFGPEDMLEQLHILGIAFFTAILGQRAPPDRRLPRSL